MNNYGLIKAGRSPVKNMLYGAGLGLGAGLVTDLIMGNKVTKGRGKKKGTDFKALLSRPLLFAALGALPGLAQGGIQYYNSIGDKGHVNITPKLDSALKWYEPFTNSSEELRKKSPVYNDFINATIKKYRINTHRDTDYDDPRNIPESSLDDRFNKYAALGYMTPNIPVGAMTNSIYHNAGCMIGAPRHNIPNALAATARRVNAPLVSPYQVTKTLINAGIGRATGAVIGKTIGALCGIKPSTYKTLKDTGMYAGMINTMNNAIQYGGI